jgi:hypothetical protein
MAHAACRRSFEPSAAAACWALVRFAFVVTGDPELAQDLVQDFMVGMVQRGTLDGISTPGRVLRMWNVETPPRSGTSQARWVDREEG